MYDFASFGHMVGFGSTASIFFILFLIWSLVWKGLALWHSAHREQGWWFVVLLVVNTAGILEIIYLFFIAKLKPAELIPARKERTKETEQTDETQK